VELTQRQKSISLLLDRMEHISTSEDLKHFAEENRTALFQFGLKTEKIWTDKKRRTAAIPGLYSCRRLSSVGRKEAAKTNDLLSTRHTAKNDLWFHGTRCRAVRMLVLKNWNRQG